MSLPGVLFCQRMPMHCWPMARCSWRWPRGSLRTREAPMDSHDFCPKSCARRSLRWMRVMPSEIESSDERTVWDIFFVRGKSPAEMSGFKGRSLEVQYRAG